MITAIIIEDEERSRKMLCALLLEHCRQISVVGEANSVQSGLEAIVQLQPQLVFLDIELQSETSFEILEKLPEINFELIFTTAFDHYALKAIKFCAIDYLLKPIDLNDLQVAIAKAEKRIQQQAMNKNLEALMNNLRSSVQNNHKIALPTMEGLIFVPVADMIYCEGDGPYTTFFLKQNQKVTTSKTLKEYEDLLRDYGFFRIHKSWLVNLQEINRYIRGDGGQLVLSNGATIDVSKKRKEDFLKIYQGK
ncbi:MAG TPA: LytTR family DNA-binding domain-containing protein [Chitinophagales bacterium]|nr:LytTR family DNA-binding domain-containing protein [Chitinophagales bacterium]